MNPEDKLQIPEQFWERTANFPESSMGANRVKLDLKDGRRIYCVSLAWGKWIVKIGTKLITSEDELDFNIADITDVISEI